MAVVLGFWGFGVLVTGQLRYICFLEDFPWLAKHLDTPCSPPTARAKTAGPEVNTVQRRQRSHDWEVHVRGDRHVTNAS